MGPEKPAHEQNFDAVVLAHTAKDVEEGRSTKKSA